MGLYSSPALIVNGILTNPKNIWKMTKSLILVPSSQGLDFCPLTTVSG